MYYFCNLWHGIQEYGAVYSEKHVPAVVRNYDHSKPLVRANQTWRPHISEHRNLNIHCPENVRAQYYDWEAPSDTVFLEKLKVACLVSNAPALYRVSQEECEILRESVPYVKLYRYNPKHLYPKLNGYGDNGQRNLKLWQLLHTYWLPNTY